MNKKEMLKKVKELGLRKVSHFNATQLQEIIYVTENYADNDRTVPFFRSAYHKTKKGIIAYLESINKAPLSRFYKKEIVKEGVFNKVIVAYRDDEEYNSYYENLSIDDLMEII